MYFREIMLGKRKGFIIRLFLRVLSLVYFVLIKIRMCGYKYSFLREKKLPVRVISVGNLTVGGSGKTPAIIEIASLLQDAGKRVGVLIRGYQGRYERQQGVVLDGKIKAQRHKDTEAQRTEHRGRKVAVSNRQSAVGCVGAITCGSPFDAGDEACLLSKNLPCVPILVGKDRWTSGRYAIQKFDCDTLLLDDGFQHLKLYRDEDILLHDVSIPQQGLRLFPEGVLREPLSSMKRARVIILTHTDMVADIAPYMEMVKRLNPGALILTSIHLPLRLIRGRQGVGIRDQGDLSTYPLSLIKGKTILACSGIGSPESFEHSLRQFEPNGIISLRFPDHYQYDSACLMRIEEMAKEADMVVTTEKDMIRLAEKYTGSFLLFFLKIRLLITTPNWQEDLLRYLCSD
ncbi:tetraacyldisaccharide 4'-kinase [Candidatus Desantisbacteria bacterium CG2_30_40_21]|nr:MAG: tetraacyldisaccharide 4'-kinase [Candidatus Desantisbacteria bacterium CG2_30_40_21]